MAAQCGSIVGLSAERPFAWPEHLEGPREGARSLKTKQHVRSGLGRNASKFDAMPGFASVMAHVLVNVRCSLCASAGMSALTLFMTEEPRGGL